MLSFGFTHIRKDFGENVGFLFSFLVLFLPGLTRYGTEIRMYAWAMLFIGITAIYTYRLYKEFNIKNLVIFGIFSLCSAYTHYYGLMSAGIINLIIFTYLLKNIKNKKKEFIYYCICAIVQVLLYVPWLIALMGPISNASGGFWITLTFPGTLIDVLTVQMAGANNNKIISLILILLLFIYIGFIIHKEKKEKNDVKIPIFAIGIYFSVIVSALLVSAIIHTAILLDRYLLVVTALYIFFLSFFMAKEKRKYITISICLIILSLSIFNTVKLVKIDYDSSNQEMINYVETNLQKDDIFLLYSNAIGGFSITTKHLENKTYFHDKENWHVEKAYQAFGPNIVLEQDLEKIMNEVRGRIWIINIPEDAFKEEIESKYNVELIERKEFNIAYDNSYFSFTIIQK